MNIVPVFVTKADGSRQLFDGEKIVTCLRMGANRHIAFEIADKVEARLYDARASISEQLILIRF